MIDSTAGLAASRQKSCNACVRGKRRCDKRAPRCSRCVGRGLDCVYYQQRTPFTGYGSEYGSPEEEMDEGVRVLESSMLDGGSSSSSGGVDSNNNNSNNTTALLDFSLADLLAVPDSSSEGWQLHAFDSSSLDDGDRATTTTTTMKKMMAPPQPAPGRDLSVLRSSEQMCLSLDPHQVHDSRSRVGFIVSFLSSLGNRFGRDGSLPFMHPRLFTTTTTTTTANHQLPGPLLAAYSAATAHSARSAHNRGWTTRLVADGCRHVLREGGSTTATGDDDAVALLARLQALTVVNAIRVFDGDVGLRAAAERDMSVLLAWLKDLVLLRDRLEVQAGPAGGRPSRDFPPDTWESWIFLESARRTIITASAFMSIFHLLKAEQPVPGVWIERQSFTASKHLWEAGSSVDFYRAWREKPHYWVENSGFRDLWMYARPADLDEFTRLMLTPYVGVDAMEHFMEGDFVMPL